MINKLQGMLEDLQNYKKDKNTLLEHYINMRLNKSLETYYKELTASMDYLTRVNNIRVMKNIGKE